jgi:DNA-binding XRE family transcriptional regulator
MRADKRRRLEKTGWAVGDASDFLGLSADERRFVEVKLVLADGLRLRRERLGLTQTEVARRVGSSQSRVAKMEAGDPTVSTDLLLKSLFRLGANPTDVARLLNSRLRGRLRVARG